jgi:hypothetical protein
MKKDPNKVSGSSPGSVTLYLRPRGLRPPAAAAHLGTTAFTIEDAWRDGTLEYRVIGGARVSTIEQLDKWFDSHPEQSGKLAKRGMFLVEAV